MTGWAGPPPAGWDDVVRRAIAEDVGRGDLTGALFGPEDLARGWFVEAQAVGVLCGVAVAYAVLEAGGPPRVADGDAVRPGTVVLGGEADPAGPLLTRERTALNFLMHLSGVATLTRRYVNAVAGTRARIVDTRKTTPGLRTLEKYAVRCGGGFNHRMGLDDGAMIKDNHIAAHGGIRPAVEALRNRIPHTVRIEVECADLGMVEEALTASADVIMLDNMDLESMAAAVRLVDGRTQIEASGGVSLETVRAIAETGVDFISVGALTHSAPALPYHLVVP